MHLGVNGSGGCEAECWYTRIVVAEAQSSSMYGLHQEDSATIRVIDAMW